MKIRVELGPKEAAAGQCVVAKCKKPGAVAAKTTVRVGAGASLIYWLALCNQMYHMGNHLL